ncbi:unnamed protein product [Soboliphyme baturini]|uniref:cAMP-regulated phosphoprotein 19 n=1 Tax=Soboliphyme baturini TaxID=241478 RepID=A0A183IQ52_9BILA|nr:unnamed protein product [Soboliphyme baturini]
MRVVAFFRAHGMVGFAACVLPGPFLLCGCERFIQAVCDFILLAKFFLSGIVRWFFRPFAMPDDIQNGAISALPQAAKTESLVKEELAPCSSFKLLSGTGQLELTANESRLAEVGVAENYSCLLVACETCYDYRALMVVCFQTVPEKLEEMKLRAKYPSAVKGKPSQFLQKRLYQRKFFDSGDYNMAKAKGLPTSVQPEIPKNFPPGFSKLSVLIDESDGSTSPTGMKIPTPDTIPHRKSSIVPDSVNKLSPQPLFHHSPTSFSTGE